MPYVRIDSIWEMVDGVRDSFVVGPDTYWFETQQYDPDFYTFRPEVYGPYPPGSSNDPLWYLSNDSLSIWVVKVEVDEEQSDRILDVPVDEDDEAQTPVKTVFRVLPDEGSSEVSFVGSPAAAGVTYWHSVSYGPESGDEVVVKSEEEFTLGDLPFSDNRYTLEWEQKDDDENWLDPAHNPYTSRVTMKWERGETRQPVEARGSVEELAAGIGLVVYLPNGNAVPEAEEQLPGKGVYVPWNSDHDNGNQYAPDSEGLLEEQFTDNDLVRIEIRLEPWTDWFASEGFRLGLRTESNRLRVWRGCTGGRENLMVDPSATSECWFSLSEDWSFLLEETQADFGDLWVEGCERSMATHDAPLTVVLSDGLSWELELDRAQFTVVYPDLIPVQEILGDEFAFITDNEMPNLRAQVRPPQLQGFVHWDIVIEYGRSNRQDYDIYTEWSSAAEQWAIRDAFGEDRRGGKATLRWSVAGATVYQNHVFHIRGENPSESDVEIELGTDPWYVVAIARFESHRQEQGRYYAQFNEAGPWGADWSDYRGCPNFGGPNGWGIMQLDDPNPSAQQLWDWRANISGGKSRLANPCRTEAESWIASQESQQQEEEPTMPLENYVFSFNGINFQKGTDRTPIDACAIQRYNGAHRWVIYWMNKTPTRSGSWEIRGAPYRDYVDDVCGEVE
ncbi:hypothetical protein JXA88_14810 [Candidatus Fermentibacteria bacterium]|nr:hypothetical protein [Candidatus Fermentibacteria bacterium]